MTYKNSFSIESIISVNANKEKYSTVLFGGSGTAVVESMLSSVVCQDSYVLIINNGAYGKRMVRIAEIHNLNFIEYNYEKGSKKLKVITGKGSRSKNLQDPYVTIHSPFSLKLMVYNCC